VLIQNESVWIDYPGDSLHIVRQIAQQIHPSVIVPQPLPERAPEPEHKREPEPEPEPEPEFVELNPEFEPIDLTEVEFTGYTGPSPKAYEVGNLRFYALGHDSLIIVRGGDLFSEFHSLWFGFQVRDRKIDLSVPYASTDDGWAPFASENSELQNAVQELVCSAVNSRNVSVILWREILTAYNEGSKRVRRLRESIKGPENVMRPPEVLLAELLEEPISDDAKMVKVRKWLRAENVEVNLYPVRWDVLEPLLTTLGEEAVALGKQVKETTFYAALAARDEEYVQTLLTDSAIQAVEHSERAEEARRRGQEEGGGGGEENQRGRYRREMDLN
jgi:hypothetical protein